MTGYHTRCLVRSYWGVSVWISGVVVLGRANLRSAESSWALIGVLLAELTVSDSLGPVLVRGRWTSRRNVGVDSKPWLLYRLWVSAAVGSDWSVSVWLARVVVLGRANLRTTESSWAFIWILLSKLTICYSLGPVFIGGWRPSCLHISIQ